MYQTVKLIKAIFGLNSLLFLSLPGQINQVLNGSLF